MNCKTCNRATPVDANYCPFCGVALNESEARIVHLNVKERLNYYLLLQILRKLSNDTESVYYDKQLEVLKNGYALHYDELFGLICGDEVSINECKEVLDILEMYSSIIRSYTKLDKSKLDYASIAFPGFDGNNENKQLAYANFFLYTLNRYEEIRSNLRNGDLNSHESVLDIYRAMLAKWNEMKDSGVDVYRMKDDEIINLIPHC